MYAIQFVDLYFKRCWNSFICFLLCCLCLVGKKFFPSIISLLTCKNVVWFTVIVFFFKHTCSFKSHLTESSYFFLIIYITIWYENTFKSITWCCSCSGHSAFALPFWTHLNNLLLCIWVTISWISFNLVWAYLNLCCSLCS